MLINNKLLTKKKPRIFLGTLLVVSSEENKRRLSNWSFFKSQRLENKLLNILEEIFTLLPPVEEINNPLDSDLVLDVVVSAFELGDGGLANVGGIPLPIFLRSTIEVRSRLYAFKTKKTEMTFVVTEGLKWRHFFSRLFTLRGFVGFFVFSMFDKKDMEYLLYKACQKLLTEMKHKNYDL